MENSYDALHQKFVVLGKERHRLTHELLALLPEIYKRQIYRAKGYFDIYEYAGKLAGISRYVVDKTLGVAKDLENKPFLKQAILSQGIHKVALVSKLATPATDHLWADKVTHMNKESLFELAREVRAKERSGEVNIKVENETDKNELELFLQKCEAAEVKLKIELDGNSQILFLKLKKEFGATLSNKEALRQMLERLNSLQERYKLINLVEERF